MSSNFDIRAAMLLYAVTDSAWLGGRDLAQCVREAVSGGVTMVQLREKDLATAEIVELAASIKPICAEAGVPFVINDDVEAALRSGADGVHVGQSDASCSVARKVLGPDAIVGVSARTVAEAVAAQEAGADYLGVGAMFGTPTKPDAADVAFEELVRICEAVEIPVTAIGGLNARTVARLAGTGADGAAVVSAIFAADDIEAAARELRALVADAVGARESGRSTTGGQT